MYPDDLLANWRSGRESWSDVSNEDWNNWKWQMSNSIRSLKHLQSLIDLTEDEKEGCELAHTKLSLSITPYYFNLIDRNDVNCPMRKQVIPSVNEAIKTETKELMDWIEFAKSNSQIWPNITVKKAPLAGADKYKNEKDKFKKYITERIF
ncbi:L-lysine 2,3-aminomutase domain protein [Candidatus Megaera venefica]|uniref:Ferredoxin n=1 Tax=Candidatus Megaera venefica TaxID=2055910 RepID=A0ABU5NEG4_9RICK|nr:DUF3470 domain-containing protein [Candidatus Megaera venefica]MEA0971567.1 L-lysine 2,3-aminomutase domain protein [Candidatus Megaera venefica]